MADQKPPTQPMNNNGGWDSWPTQQVSVPQQPAASGNRPNPPANPPVPYRPATPTYQMQQQAPPRPYYAQPAYQQVATKSGPSGGVVVMAWILCFCTLFYLLPWAIAATRGRRNLGSVFLVNFFAGWFLVGWVIALVMACSDDNSGQVVVVNNHYGSGYGR